MFYPHQAQEVARLARDFPNQAFIVNHCGSPIDRDRDGMARWREKLLGSAPNVQIKISALTAYDRGCAKTDFRCGGVARQR